MPRYLVLLAALGLAACGSDHGLHRTTRLLNDRLQAQLAPDIAAGKVALQPLPDGAQVTLTANSRFSDSVKTRTDQYPDVRSGVVEGLLDPSLVRIAVSDTSGLPEEERATRVRNVIQYFQDNGLGQTVVPEAGPPGSSAVPGLVLTIQLDCPTRRRPTNWGYAPTIPSCS